MLRLPTTRRAYLRSAVAGVAGFFALYIIAHVVLSRFGVRAEQTYIDDALLGVLMAFLVIAIEAQHQAEVGAEKSRMKTILDLDRDIRSAVQTIAYVTSVNALPDERSQVAEAAGRIEIALHDMPTRADVERGRYQKRAGPRGRPAP